MIRERLPDFDLTAGPQIDASAPAGDSQHVSVTNNNATDQQSQRQTDRQLDTVDSGIQRSSRKRVVDEIDESDQDDSITEGAQSVATNLGMLSLNSDSSQRHYIGSSSGLLFTALIGASPRSEKSMTNTAQSSDPSMTIQQVTFQSQDAIRKRYYSLHLLLRQVGTQTQTKDMKLIREGISEEGRRHGASADLPKRPTS